jgi:hypothetical protein
MAMNGKTIRACFDELHHEDNVDSDINLNKQGIYLVYFYINGEKTPVIVDDRVPCYKNSKKPIFTDHQPVRFLSEEG